jgi:ribonucleoside-diphosphate reductase alpha chain
MYFIGIFAKRGIMDKALESGKANGFRTHGVTASSGCLVDESLIVTNYGLVQLGQIGNPQGNKHQPISISVATPQGPRQATQFFINGLALTRKIDTNSGYSIQGTKEHRIRVVDPDSGEWLWKRFAELKAGDITPLAMDSLIGEPHQVELPPFENVRYMNEDLAELLGYFGAYSLSGGGTFTFPVEIEDRDVADRLEKILYNSFHLRKVLYKAIPTYPVEVKSPELGHWWAQCGFTNRNCIPQAVLYTNNPQYYRAYLRGVFEGSAKIRNGSLSLNIASESLFFQIKNLLLAFGIPTATVPLQSYQRPGYDHVLRFQNTSYNKVFKEKIGFIGARKNGALAYRTGAATFREDFVYLPSALLKRLHDSGLKADHVKLNGAVSRHYLQDIYLKTCDSELGDALRFFYDKVSSNTGSGEQMTYDLSVPDELTYNANGFISHNTITQL